MGMCSSVGERGRPRRLRAPLAIPLLLLVISALGGQLVSYDASRGWAVFSFIMVGVVLCYSLADGNLSETGTRLVAMGLLVTGAVLAGYFVTQYAHLGYPDKMGWATWLGTNISRWFPRVGSFTPYPNAVAAYLEGLLPLGVAVVVGAPRREFRLLGALTVGLVALALAISASRGAWLALVLTGMVWLWVRFRPVRLWLALAGSAVVVASTVCLVVGGGAGWAGEAAAAGECAGRSICAPRPVGAIPKLAVPNP